jgi:alcohol dehydrogenase class IV
MTPVLGETSNGVKRTQSSPKILPEVVIYDVDLTLTLPASTAGVSGMNAIAHAVEALYAQDRNPVIRLMALEAITALAQALPRIHDDPDDVAAREAALYGAWLCGMCLGAVGMALHHKLCHTLGGSFNLPHAETHTVILPYAVAYNAAVMEDAAALATALGSVDPVEGLLDLNRRIGAPASLAALGMLEDGIDRAAELAMANAYWNPQPLEHEAIRQLIARAYRGDPPARA